MPRGAHGTSAAGRGPRGRRPIPAARRARGRARHDPHAFRAQSTTEPAPEVHARDTSAALREVRDLRFGRARIQSVDRRAFLLAAVVAPFGLRLADVASGAFEVGSPLAFVTADLDAHVAVVDLERPRVVAWIPTFPGPRSIETIGKTALVAHTAHGRISLVDTGARRVRQVLEGFGEPR